MLLDRRAFFRDQRPLSHLNPLNFYEFASTRFTLASVINVFTMRALARLAAVERHCGPFDVVHDNQSLGYGLLMTRSMLGRPVVANVHHPLDVDARNALRHVHGLPEKMKRIAWYPWQMQRVVARRLDALISGSRASTGLITRLWSLPEGHLRTIYDGVDTQRFHPNDESEMQPGTLLFVGNAEDYNKGIVYLLRGMAMLPSSLRARLYVVGGPTGKPRIALREIERLRIADRVTIVGRVSDDELAGWYRRAQLLVSPSLYEGFGLPAAEAMASGTPVVATDAGALPEVVADGETGLVVPPADAAALADAIAELLDAPERCRELGRAGRQRVLDQFTWPHHAHGLDALYRDVLANRGRS
jgi:glycosyltransferase involved in cell wall biosynthesis